jgi:signal transduction histidine kinase
VSTRVLGERTRLISQQIDYEAGIASSLLFTGIALWFTSDLEESLRDLIEAKRRFSAIDDEVGRMKAQTFVGCVYRSLGDYDRSYLDLTECVDYFRERGDHFWESIVAMSLAITCEQIGDTKGMERYNRRVIGIATDPELRWMVGRALNGLGNRYLIEERYDEAREYFEKALVTCRESIHRVSEARALNDVGTAWQHLGDFEKAERFYRESLEIRNEIGQREAQCTCLFNLGELAIETGEADRALAHFNQALDIATEVGAKPRISQAHKHLSRACELTGDATGALRHHKLFHEMNEEVAREQSTTRMKNLTTRLELDKAEKLAEVEQQKNLKLSEQNDELQRLLDALQRAQAHVVQYEKMAVLGKLVAGVAHELNTPVGASAGSIDVSKRCVVALADLMQSAASLDELRESGRMRKLLDSLATNNDVVFEANERISKIVRSLKSFARLDEAPFQNADIHDGLDATINLLEADGQSEVQIQREYGTIPKIDCYPGELNQVFLNVLTNSVEAVQRKDGDGGIVVRTSNDDEHVSVEIKDNGVGIPEAKLTTLFDPEFSDSKGRVKAGIGLFVSHNIVEKHHGTITVASEIGKGTTVTVVLPVAPEGPSP